MFGSWRAAVAVTIIAATLGAAAPAPTPDAATVIAGIQAYWSKVKSYEVPVSISGHARVSIVSIPFTMDGTEYYLAPDREALHLNNAPSAARGFENTIGSMGTPESWPRTYDIVLAGTQMHNGHNAYVLTGTPRRSGTNVKTVTMWVNTRTYAIMAVQFNYNNGAQLSVVLSHHGKTLYHLPTTATLTAQFPSYSGSATITYGAYSVNVPIDAAVFQKQ